ncbi:hypothetical protein MKX07_001408 [Trichoderma sp. CBMAI-0711]|nr:hypothetical protein MKX07_001408 [Trichoderma sp. CBMAI-0711]
MKMKRQESANETAEIGDMSKLGPWPSALLAAPISSGQSHQDTGRAMEAVLSAAAAAAAAAAATAATTPSVLDQPPNGCLISSGEHLGQSEGQTEGQTEGQSRTTLLHKYEIPSPRINGQHTTIPDLV